MALSLAVLVRFQLAGDFLVRALGLPVPGSLIGLVGLTLVLLVLGRVPAALGKVSGGLLRNMMLMLAPAVVGLIDNFGRVREEWLPFLVAGVVGSVITLAVTAVTLQYLLRRSDTASVADPAEGSKA
ncbi:CidA/LrgA family protein [Diaphorobacter sp. NR2-3-3-1]|nr:CidA/LrgA family protein [Diaphorobacter caeni]